MNFFIKIIVIFWLAFVSVAKALGASQHSSIIFQVNHSQMIFDNSAVDSATITSGKSGIDRYGVNVKLKIKAAATLSDMCKKNIGKRMDIVLNGKIISSAIIQSELGRNFEIAGLTKKQAVEFIQSLCLTCN